MIHHKRKMIPPIASAVFVILYLLVYFGFLISIVSGVVWKVLLGVIPVLLGTVMIFVCIQRIREIKGGEEDDLSQY